MKNDLVVSQPIYKVRIFYDIIGMKKNHFIIRY